MLSLSIIPSFQLSAQTVDDLAIRFAGMTAVTGLEQAMTDTLLTLVPGSIRDRAGNVTVSLGSGTPKRLVACALDEVGYVVGNITPDGYLTLRRVGAPPTPLFDQQLEGERVTVFGARGAVPGIGAVRSTHLTRGRIGPSSPDPVFTVDNAYVDLGAASAADARALGIDLLSPVSLAKRPHRYGDRLLAAPAAARRASCAALAAAVQGKPKVRGTVVAAFTVRSLYATTGVEAVQSLQGPFAEALLLWSGRRTAAGRAPADTLALATRYTDTAVETVSLKDGDALAKRLVRWMEAR
ncbi:MAG: hypothetical protein AUH06_09095 [Gemmatimonadetes bacterium 13_2_20CM_69_27]|nr:MAG: hypothetical protein AUH06_09095 [Gemmatimonadetes bacterium 13_2_20CM_69_27]OLB57346.1 MAG: hypothetical protein AUI13_08595 [Gemmatimonadetes bacterium 13_2_20CM_2_69_23]OLD59703.1 MAG: hypothetical protein AUF60_04350 [Gemmatimonadetes bacterium 13_1_20CM_69_28]